MRTDHGAHRCCEFYGCCEFCCCRYKDYISTVVDPVHDPITAGLGSYVVTDELYWPKVRECVCGGKAGVGWRSVAWRDVA